MNSTDRQSCNVLDIIERKKHGVELTRADIYCFVEGYVAGTIPDYQGAALLMAICLRGFSLEETVAYTEALVDSGSRLEWKNNRHLVVDKHSTGGVGDKTSLVVVPLAVACGLVVPKLSGRGLGLTGGTIDKLESITGFRADLSAGRVKTQTMSIGGVIASQGPDLVPGDGIIYSLRDVTATVDSMPLIAASVMSKKIATGASTIAIDMKVGSGALVKGKTDANHLAETMISIGRAFGIKVRVYFTDMSQPIGRAVGHSTEVAEAINILEGEGPDDVRELAVTIVSGLLRDSGLLPQPRAARSSAESHLDNGDALSVLDKIVAMQGGSLMEFRQLPPHDTVLSNECIPAPKTGYISRVDPIGISNVVRRLGGARFSKNDPIDLSVGITELLKVGETVVVGDPLCRLHANSQVDSKNVKGALLDAFEISEGPNAVSPLVIGQRVS